MSGVPSGREVVGTKMMLFHFMSACKGRGDKLSLLGLLTGSIILLEYHFEQRTNHLEMYWEKNAERTNHTIEPSG